MYGLFFFCLIIVSMFLLIGSRPKGRAYGLIAGIIGAFMGSSVGIASSGSATSGTLLFGMIFFIVGSVVGNKSRQSHLQD